MAERFSKGQLLWHPKDATWDDVEQDVYTPAIDFEQEFLQEFLPVQWKSLLRLLECDAED